ncbi:hypothetical protein FRC12_008089 [Ceratobasidium sp. 428]|nr:hypothetical protein FRC12_008089 [Ceratobasidium sp. 428]
MHGRFARASATLALGPSKRGLQFPVLFASLDADLVTPLSSAVKMSRGFGKESATLLTHQRPGYIYPTDSTSSKRGISGLDKRDAELLGAVHGLREVRSKFNPDILGK